MGRRCDLKEGVYKFFNRIIRFFRLIGFIFRILRLENIGLLMKSYFFRFFLRRKVPLVCFWGISSKCQFQCVYCGASQYPQSKKEVTFNESLLYLDKLKKELIPRIHLTGKEALLWPGIDELIQEGAKRGFVLCLETNGWALDRQRLEVLKEHGLNMVCLSLDSHIEEIHDQCCQVKGSYKKVISVVRWAKEFKLPIVISTILRRPLLENNGLRDLVTLCEKEKVDGIRLIAPRLLGEFQGRSEEALSKEEKADALNIMESFTIPILGQGPDEKVCGAYGNYGIYISPEGEVQPCGYIPYSFGSILEEDLALILKKIEKSPIFKERSGCKLEDPTFYEKYLKPVENVKELPIRPEKHGINDHTEGGNTALG